MKNNHLNFFWQCVFRTFCCQHKSGLPKVYDSHTGQWRLHCIDCSKKWPIPVVLTRASGIFERIDIRCEQQAEFARLNKLAEQYQREV